MNRVAVVTGAASGMGLAVGRLLATRGYRVALLDLDGDGAERAAKDLCANGAKALGCKVDVVDRSEVDEAMRTVRKEFGPIEIVVTSAGFSAFERFIDITLDLEESRTPQIAGRIASVDWHQEGLIRTVEQLQNNEQ